MFQTTSQQVTQGDKCQITKMVSLTGYKFAREEIIEKLSEIDINDIDSWILDRLAEMMEGNQL